MKNHFLATLLCVAMAPAAYAVPFDTTTVGGTATVGSGGDYATLKAAADAFNALSSPHLQGNWKLEILNDLDEPQNVAFGNTVPSNSSLTVKPAANTSSTVTFTAVSDNGGVSGHLVIGDNNLDNWDLVPTERVIIDGSNNGTNSRNLTITNTTDNAHTYSGPVTVVGQVNNIAIKNAYLINKGTTAGAGPSGIQMVIRMKDGVALSPKNTLIENNLIHLPQAQAHGIHMRVSGTVPAGAAVESITGTKIIGNTIQTRLRGIFSDAGLDAEITGNVINVGVVGSGVNGFLHPAIYVNNARSSTNQTLTVAQNQIFIQNANVAAGDYGPVATYVANSGTAASGNTVNFDNNMVNLRVTGTAATAFNYTAFRATSGIKYNIRNNSINLPNSPNQTGLTSDRAAAINLPETVAYTADIRNNIIRIDQAGVTGIKMVGGTPTVTSDNNVIYRVDTAFTGSTGAVGAVINHASLADWQGATGFDGASQPVDPTATAGSKWEVVDTNADLHFYPQNVKPVGIILQPRLADVLVDIDGQNREPQTLPGADEVVVGASVSDWSVY